MKKLLLFFGLLFLLGFSNAQSLSVGQLTKQDIELFQEIENETNSQRINDLAIELIWLSDDKAPIPLLEEAKMLFDLSQKKRDSSLESIAMTLYAQGYRITGDFTKSQQYHFKAIAMAKEKSNYSLLAYALNQSAHIYKDREENDKAIAIYKQAREAANKGTESLFKFYPTMNLGFVYLQAGRADSALYYCDKALGMAEELLSKVKDPNKRAVVERSLYAYCLSNLASAYSTLNDKTNATRYYKKAGHLIEKYKGSKSRYFQFYYFSLAKHYQRYALTDSALYAARMAIESVSGGSLEYLSAKPAKMLSDYYESRNADSTVKYLKIYLKGNEVMNSTRVTQQLQMKVVEEEQRSREIQQAANAFRNKVIVYLLLGGLVGTLLLALYMYHSGQQRKRTNAELQQQKTALEKALTELKSTQTQLIQSEKMASLGELTAGIAHEIQNPLNFVNNFSEVNTELLAELADEVRKGNLVGISALTKGIIENEQKINHHGKRAGDIVKGMLQHSRTSSGQKELTDINVLCDEYLRLAYHGLKAKDKSFNAKFETDLDASLPMSNVVPQDIGRVILNLINNAFYAVSERQRSVDRGYEPTVLVSTKKLLDNILISVKDNGNGIPQKVLDKIFQPFFTTKPTGQGTGLGLSLSYDVVKAHGGELKVETKEGTGTQFSIILPLT